MSTQGISPFFSVYLFMLYDDTYGSKHVEFHMLHKKIVGFLKLSLLFILHGTASAGKYKACSVLTTK
jgi:hypothetical protein